MNIEQPQYLHRLEPFVAYGVFDAARMGDQLQMATDLSPQSTSLYRGVEGEKLSSVGPYLMRFGGSAGFNSWFLANGWGNSWGLLFSGSESFEQLYSHFRRFLIVKDEEEQKLYFRFYDPRVFRVFLPTCNALQLKEFFGPVDYYIVEDEDATKAIFFSHERGTLKRVVIDLTKDDQSTPFLPPKKAAVKSQDRLIV